MWVISTKKSCVQTVFPQIRFTVQIFGKVVWWFTPIIVWLRFELHNWYWILLKYNYCDDKIKVCIWIMDASTVHLLQSFTNEIGRLGTIQILRKHSGWVLGSAKWLCYMLKQCILLMKFAYKVGGLRNCPNYSYVIFE